VNDWTVTVGAATAEHLDEPTLVEVAQHAEQWDGTVGARGEAGPGFVLIVDIPANNPIDAGPKRCVGPASSQAGRTSASRLCRST
jgi:hypothetical protein